MAQRSWRTFATLADASSGTRGRTAAAIRLLAEDIAADEDVVLVATGEVKTLWSWEDGAVALTARRLLVAESPDRDSGSLTDVDLRDGPEITEMQAHDNGTRRFRVIGLEASGIGLRAEQFGEFRTAVERAVEHVRQAAGSKKAVHAIALLTQLRKAGVLTAAEFGAKHRLVLQQLRDRAAQAEDRIELKRPA